MDNEKFDFNVENQDIEIKLLLEAIHLKYGYDLKEYSAAYAKRRILQRLVRSEIKSISELQHLVLYDRSYFETLLLDFSINVTEMFRDPLFFKSLREEVIPILKTYPFVKIWHAGCSTGEEVYSMAIMLKEEGLQDKVQIYATDFNAKAIEKAKEGIYSIQDIKKYTDNYYEAGGKGVFSDYYVAGYDSVIFDRELKKRVTFADHNLITDGVFGEMNLIICRNVLIYFQTDLQKRVIKLFLDSLGNGCFLGLGSGESIQFSGYGDKFDNFIEREKIFRKKYPNVL